MSVASLLDGTMTIWRRAETKSTRGIVLRAPLTAVARDVVCTYQERRGLQARREAGERRIIDGRVYCSASADVTDGDILEITSGPAYLEVPLLEVDAHYSPRGNHMQVMVKEWDGLLS